MAAVAPAVYLSKAKGLLMESGEFFAAGFHADPALAPVQKIARGVMEHLRGCKLPPYRGEVFYPFGMGIWRDSSCIWHDRVRLQYDRAALQTKIEKAEGEQRAALEALRDYWDAYPMPGGYTHSIPNFERVLSEGLKAHEERVNERFSEALPSRAGNAPSFYAALRDVLRGIRYYHARLIKALELRSFRDPARERNRKRILQALSHVPFESARNFWEAIVCTHFIFVLDTSDDLGRFDQYLRPYYEQSLAEGLMTQDEAREWIAALWEHVDLCNGWNVALGGTKADGAEASSDLTILCLEAAKGRRRPNLALRVRRDTPEEVWNAALDCIASGCGLPALYCEENYLEALRDADLGIREEDLPEFAFGGCTEIMIQGHTNAGSLDECVNLPKVLVQTLHEHLATAEDYQDFYGAYKRALRREIETMAQRVSLWQQEKAGFHPHLVRSLLIDDCIDRCKDFTEGGARYNWSVINVEGLANAIDSLAAVRSLVFRKGVLSAERLLEALRADFDGYADVKRMLESCPRYGNDDEAADDIAEELSTFVFEELLSRRPWRGGRFVPACLMFVTYANEGKGVGATPDGRHANAPIADSAGAHQGRDRNGPTALLKSVARLNQKKAPGTLVVNIRLSGELFQTTEGREKVKSLVRGYFDMGGMQIQVNVVDQQTLLDAVKHPERHENLIIRVGGYSEYFNRLSDELKRTVLERTEHGLG